jgi:hypothetical protein
MRRVMLEVLSQRNKFSREVLEEENLAPPSAAEDRLK